MNDGCVFLQLASEAGRRQFTPTQGHMVAHGLASGHEQFCGAWSRACSVRAVRTRRTLRSRKPAAAAPSHRWKPDSAWTRLGAAQDTCLLERGCGTGQVSPRTAAAVVPGEQV